MISSGTSMGATIYKITSKSKPNNKKDINSSPSTSFSPYISQRTTNNLRTKKLSSVIDLMKQSKLSKEPLETVSKSYYLNLLKIQLKKNIEKNNFPLIKTFSSLKYIPSINYNTLHTLTNTNFLKDKYMKAFSHENLKNKNKKKTLYKNIYNKNPQNMRIVYVNKFLGPKHNNNNTYENYKNIDNFKIKNKTEDNFYNLHFSSRKFMVYHGLNKTNKKNEFDLNPFYKNIDNKYKGLDNKKIRQFFLKKKLNKVNNKMKSIEKDVQDAKDRINNLYYKLNKDIQFDISEEYKKA